MKYDQNFSDPVYFSDGTIVFHYSWTRNQCLDYMEKEYGETDEFRLKTGFVRFGFPPKETTEGYDDLDVPCWYTGCSESKGARKVWIYGK